MLAVLSQPRHVNILCLGEGWAVGVEWVVVGGWWWWYLRIDPSCYWWCINFIPQKSMWHNYLSMHMHHQEPMIYILCEDSALHPSSPSQYSQAWQFVRSQGFGSTDKVSKKINRFVPRRNKSYCLQLVTQLIYHKTSNISRTLVGNKTVDHSDVVGASPVGAAPTTSSSLI